MPAIANSFAEEAGLVLEALEATSGVRNREVVKWAFVEKRIDIPYNRSSPPGLIEANTLDPFSQSGKYALGWVYFCIVLLVVAILIRLYHLWTDKIRTALHKEFQCNTISPSDRHHEMPVLHTDKSPNTVVPRTDQTTAPHKTGSAVSGIRPLNKVISMFRFIFYRPIPLVRLGKKWTPMTFPSLAVTLIVCAAFIFVILYCFVPPPLYWQSIRYGSPPLAVRAGMLAVAMMPWIIAMSMKANLVSLLTGIGHERLNVLHRWAAYICLFLSLVHTVPFYVAPVEDVLDLGIFKSYFSDSGPYIYGTGIAALVPLIVLCLHSLPVLRRWMHELFVSLHVPIAIVYLAMLFWHCKNYITSWHYLYATTAIWLMSYVLRFFYLNWTHPRRVSWLIGEEAVVTTLPENALKITIPTQIKWRPGQYVYLRMPGISLFENHPFTIASLCSNDFPSEYGEEYRDIVLVFRPFGGFTKKVLKAAVERGPLHTYRAFIDGPYGGTQRQLDAFDSVILIAGGSGITAVVSQLLNLVKRMRDGKAVTKHVQVIWALKRPETMEWFKEELRICRQFAPPESVQCQFYITSAKRQAQAGQLVETQSPSRPVSATFHDKVNDTFQDIANKRHSFNSAKRNSALIRDEAANDPEREKELRAENEDRISALPEAHVIPQRSASRRHLSPPEQARPSQQDTQAQSHSIEPARIIRTHARDLSIDIPPALAHGSGKGNGSLDTIQARPYNFGFPTTPTEFQKNLMRFAFLPAALHAKRDGWSVEYGRPDLPFMLREGSKHFGRRSCVFVCGPPSMRVAVSNTIAGLQKLVWMDEDKEEIFLYTENYAL